MAPTTPGAFVSDPDGGVYLAQAEDGSTTWWRRATYPSADEALEAHGRECLDAYTDDGIGACQWAEVRVRLVWMAPWLGERGWWCCADAGAEGAVECWEVENPPHG